MAKRSGASTFNKILNSIPSKAEFDMVMVADTTAENYVDIDTGIDDNQAWVIYGLEYWFENTDPTVPLPTPLLVALSWQLQLQRGDDSEIFYNINDKECILNHKVTIGLSATADANFIVSPFKLAKRALTMQETLRLMFRTNIDCAALTTAMQMSGCIYYDTVPAPRGVATKIGQLSDL